MAKKQDPKDLLLLALYAEFNKEAGDYRMATARLLDMEGCVWRWSLMCLQTEGLIDGVKWLPPNVSSAEDVPALNTNNLRLTAQGVTRAREILCEDGRNRKEALMRILDYFTAAGVATAREYLMRCL